MADGNARTDDSSDMSVSSLQASPPSIPVPAPVSAKDSNYKDDQDESSNNNNNGGGAPTTAAYEGELLPPPPFPPPSSSDQLVRPPPMELVASVLEASVAPGVPHAADALLDLSLSLTARAADEGQLYGFLAVYAALGRQGCAALARGELEPPPAAFRCRAALLGLAARHRGSRDASPAASATLHTAGTTGATPPLTSVGDTPVLREIEPLPRSEHGTPADAAARRLYALVLAFVLQETVLAHELARPDDVVRTFSSADLRVPALSLLRFVERLLRYLPATKELFVVGLIYLDRALAADPQLRITATNVHRLYFAAMVVASKFFDDYFLANSSTARIAGLTLKDLRDLEVDFLAGVSFSLYVDDALYRAYLEPFEQLVGLLRILPVDTDNDTLPAFRTYPACGKWTWTPLDELFYYIQTERQRLASTSTYHSQSVDQQQQQQQQQRIGSLLSPSATGPIAVDPRKSYATLPRSSEMVPRDDRQPSMQQQQQQQFGGVDTDAASSDLRHDIESSHRHHRRHHRRHHHHHDEKAKKHKHRSSTKTSDIPLEVTQPSKRKKDKSIASTTEEEEKKRKHHSRHHHHHRHHHKRKTGAEPVSVQKAVLAHEHPRHSSAIMRDEQQSGYRSA